MFNSNERNSLYEVFDAYSLKDFNEFDFNKAEKLEFSEKFEQKMQKLIKRRRKPTYYLFNTTLKKVACIAVSIIIAFSGVLLSVDALRQSVKKIFIDVCAVNGCNSETVAFSKYCEKHTCYEDDCYNLRLDSDFEYGYCEEHTCKKENCFNIKTDESDFCVEHTCANPDCYAEVEKGIWCNIHACKHPDCLNEAIFNGETCSEHICPMANCNNLFITCSHKCKKSDCLMLATSDGYCSAHKPPIKIKPIEIGPIIREPVNYNPITVNPNTNIVSSKRRCSVNGCAGEAYKDGLCYNHYNRNSSFGHSSQNPITPSKPIKIWP